MGLWFFQRKRRGEEPKFFRNGKVMEKKKLLAMAVSIGVILVFVTGAAILIFTQKTPAPQKPILAGAAGSANGSPGAEAPEPEEPATVDPAEMVRNQYQGLQTPPANAGNQDNAYYINTDPSAQVTVEKKREDASALVISVPRPASAAVPDAPPERPLVQPAAKPSVPKRQAPPPIAPPKAAERPVVAYDAYWVQTGSFSTKPRADSAKERLAVKGITAIIENRDVEGKSYYRVRVGPYTSQNEADYWLGLIKNLEGFEDSQVWKSQAKRVSVNSN